MHWYLYVCVCAWVGVYVLCISVRVYFVCVCMSVHMGGCACLVYVCILSMWMRVYAHGWVCMSCM